MAEPRSNYSAEQLLETTPEDIRNIPEVTEWFADVYRWADIERIEDIKADAWVALQQNDDLTYRQHHIDVLTAKLESYVKITCEEDAEPDLDPPTPSIKSATHTIQMDTLTDSVSVSDPVLPSRTGINPTA